MKFPIDQRKSLVSMHKTMMAFDSGVASEALIQTMGGMLHEGDADPEDVAAIITDVFSLEDHKRHMEEILEQFGGIGNPFKVD